jgi:hypothetical protein
VRTGSLAPVHLARERTTGKTTKHDGASAAERRPEFKPRFCPGQVHNEGYDGQDDQNVNRRSGDVKHRDAKQPSYQQNNSDYCKHLEVSIAASAIALSTACVSPTDSSARVGHGKRH